MVQLTMMMNLVLNCGSITKDSERQEKIMKSIIIEVKINNLYDVKLPISRKLACHL